jgi:hypothetical protein
VIACFYVISLHSTLLLGAAVLLGLKPSHAGDPIACLSATFCLQLLPSIMSQHCAGKLTDHSHPCSVRGAWRGVAAGQSCLLAFTPTPTTPTTCAAHVGIPHVQRS